MDVVAGEPKLETEVRQHSARFRLDYSQVHSLQVVLFANISLASMEADTQSYTM